MPVLPGVLSTDRTGNAMNSTTVAWGRETTPEGRVGAAEPLFPRLDVETEAS